MPSEESEPTYQDVLHTRSQEEFILFARLWIEAQRTGDYSSEYHMNLLACSSRSPVQSLAIILNLLDFSVNEDEMLQEMIAMGPVGWFLRQCPASFHSIAQEAAMKHPGFALCTTWKRQDPDDPASIWFGKI